MKKIVMITIAAMLIIIAGAAQEAEPASPLTEGEVT